MLLNPDVYIIGVEGTPLLKVVGEGGEPDILWQLRDIVVNALYGDEKTVATGMEKHQRGELGERIYQATEDSPAIVTTDEVAQIKKLIGESYPIVFVTPVWRMLEKLPQEPEPVEIDIPEDEETGPPRSFRMDPPPESPKTDVS